MTLGYGLHGSGAEKVIVMHDWFCDQSSYDFMIPFLDTSYFTYCFVDLRGYGKSKHLPGKYTVDEIIGDIIKLAEKLEWQKFHIVGHSMTGMVVQKIINNYPDKIKGSIAITPVPACGAQSDEDTLKFMEHAAWDNDEFAKQAADMMSGNRLSKTFLNYKVKKWRKTSTAEARVAYCHMFVKTNFVNEIEGCSSPLLVIAGEYDAEYLREQVQRDTILKWYPNAEIMICKNAAHYPMMETPIFLATTIENYLKEYQPI